MHRHTFHSKCVRFYGWYVSLDNRPICSQFSIFVFENCIKLQLFSQLLRARYGFLCSKRFSLKQQRRRRQRRRHRLLFNFTLIAFRFHGNETLKSNRFYFLSHQINQQLTEMTAYSRKSQCIEHNLSSKRSHTN